MNNCEIIKDLLPLYVDDLTSQETNKFIETHIDSCESCKEEFDRMQKFQPTDNSDLKAIDYMKKVNKRNRRILIFAILGLLLGIFIVPNLIPRQVKNLEEVNYSMYFDIEKGQLLVNARDPQAGIKLDMEEDNGVAYFTVKKTPKDWFYPNTIMKEFGRDGDVRRVELNGDLVYESGRYYDQDQYTMLSKKVDSINDKEGLDKLFSYLKLERFGQYSYRALNEEGENIIEFTFTGGQSDPGLTITGSDLKTSIRTIYALVGDVDKIKISSPYIGSQNEPEVIDGRSHLGRGDSSMFEVKKVEDIRGIYDLREVLKNIQDIYDNE